MLLRGLRHLCNLVKAPIINLHLLACEEVIIGCIRAAAHPPMLFVLIDGLYAERMSLVIRDAFVA